MSSRSPHTPGPFSVLGIDLSLTSTGLARVHCQESGVSVSTMRLKPAVKGHDRLDLIVDTVTAWALPVDYVALEGPSYGSQSSSYHQLAGLWWLVRHELWTMRVPTAVMAPQARAKYATGRGNSGKDEVLAAVIRRYAIPLEVDVPGNDVADALVLAAMAARHLGRAVEEKVPEVNAEALAKVQWA